VPELQRELAWAWVRAGNLARARAAVQQGGADPDDEIHGWMALYEGDLARARSFLRGATQRGGADAVTALALLGRTRADSSGEAGAAFLALARGDSTDAAQHFVAAAAQLPDAAPLLLATAARVALARRDTTRAVALWTQVVGTYAESPEAAEAELSWARTLRAQGDTAAAATHLEHLILTFPESALVPQARRELELARGTVPPPAGTPP
jgi:tetratricopeptide (TPR) repeat protein